jgi:hypothetical protein
VRRLTAAAFVLAAVAALAPPVDAFLIFGGGVRWRTFPVRYVITDRNVPGVSAGQVQAAVATAFASWQATPSAQVSTVFDGFTNAEPDVDGDGLSVIGFQSRPDLPGVLGQTKFTVDTVTSQLLESDILLNTIFNWSVAPNGETARFDVQSIATHEIGHFFGLGHSALGETELIGGQRRVLGKSAVMFPIAFPPGNTEDRRLKPDDVAGISGIYPTPAFLGDTAAITGRVVRNGVGVLGAHVMAIHPATGVTVGALSLNDEGQFTILGLEPGLYLLRVEPLDDADTRSFFLPGANVDIDFRVSYFPTLVPAPAGGAGQPIVIGVTPK